MARRITITKEEARVAAAGRVDRALRAGRHRGLPAPVVFAVLGFGVLVAAALLLDGAGLLGRLSRPARAVEPVADLLIEMAGSSNRYVNAGLGFSIALPPRWSVAAGEAAAPFDVYMSGPNAMGVAIQVTEVSYTSIDTLVGRLQAIEREHAIDTHIEKIEFKGHPAARRHSRLTREAVHALDVLAEGREYHVQFSLSAEMDEAYRPVVQEMLNSFEPTHRVAGDEASL